ncbi:nucleotidyltransferase domain-containing protein [Sorangium sp. So ce426]|uniref:nucleotidyltransferase domain-containing protein n=1 Tax=Sorangium sp. So ce426 TaxID=3133312 RepID=UPI003F5B1476
MAPRTLQSKKRRAGATGSLPRAGEPAAATDLRPIVPLVERIIARLAPEEIWLFGSRAEGRARPDSDYDLLAVLSDDAPDSALDLMKAWELTCGLGVPADLVPCTRSDFEADKDEVGTLARAAYHRGRRIYERRA